MKVLRLIIAFSLVFPVATVVLTQPTFESELDITALIRECKRNLELFDGIYNYSFTQKRTIRRFNNRGEMRTKEVVISEAYPTRNRRSVILVKISENDRPLSPQKIAAERERAAKRIEESERRRQIDQPKDRQESGYFRLGFGDFLDAGEFSSPRRHKFGDRNELILDFRPRADFRPKTRSEAILLNLFGSVLIDTENKQIIRVEAYPSNKGYRTSSKPLGLIHPNAALIFERKPTPEGVWSVSLMHFDTISHSELFNKTPLNMTFEFSDYRRFDTYVDGYETGKPNPQP